MDREDRILELTLMDENMQNVCDDEYVFHYWRTEGIPYDANRQTIEDIATDEWKYRGVVAAYEFCMSECG